MTGPPVSAVPILPPAKLRLAAAFLAISNLIVILDMTVANVSVPHIAGSLGMSLDQGSWIITSYAVAEALTLPLTGWLTMRFGTVRMYVVCMTAFGFFSLLCAVSLTLQMIIVARIGQGMCGGLLMALAQTLLLRVFPDDQRGKAILLSAMTVLLGPALGPNLGGWISDTFSWHWIFLINLPIVAVCVTAALALLGPIETPLRKLPIDKVGLLLMVTWIGAMQFMLDLGRNRDWFADPLIVVLAIVALVGFIAFVIWELTEEHPVVDIRIFRHSGFAFGVIALSLCFGSYFAGIVIIPQWLQGSLGYSAQNAGFIVAGTAITALIGGPLAARVAAKGVDPRLMISLAVAWIGCMALVRATWTADLSFWQYATPQLIQGFGMAFFMLPLTAITLNSVRPEEMASATGIQNFCRTLIIGVATAIAMTVWGDTQQEARAEMTSRLQPGETLRQLGEAGFTQEQGVRIISGVVEREAVTTAIDYVFLLTAAAFFLSALVIWLAPRPKAAGAQ